jgi:predicted amidophosphoribosyltransferase
MASLWQISAICKICRYPLENFRGLPIISDTLLQICQRVANTLSRPVKNLPKGCQQPLEHLQEGCANCTERGNLCAIPLKKVKFKVKNQEAMNIY